jgi:cell division protein FtsQ
MWANPRLLNLAAGFLVGVALLAFAAAGVHALLRSELFPVRQVALVTPVERMQGEALEATVRSLLRGNFFAADIEAVRAGVESLPWVRRAAVRRVWPDRLEIAVEEHVALARWGEEALVNTFGERFAGRAPAGLPHFVAPPGSEGQVAYYYLRFAEAVAPLGTSVERVVLTPRLAWQLRLANGVHLMLGRDGEQAHARLRRFVAAYPSLDTRGIRTVDLRYPNGFALRLSDPRS